ncbi:MAG: DUF1800 domain-containing protein [Bacteroidota bacterium]
MKQWVYFLLLCGLSPGLLAQTYTDYLGNGHQLGITVTSSPAVSSEQNGQQTINGFPTSSEVLLGDASRFLAQASFGGNWAEIQELSQKGYEAWLTDQLALPPTLLTSTAQGMEELIRSLDDGEFFFSYREFRSIWFHSVMTAPDQLRHRVAFALSEIMVISDSPDELEDSGIGLTNYYDILVRHGLGNYRDLLREVSLHPTMGFYLSHLNNPKSDSSRNIHPDENYAREVMQLFSIGLYELNMDGTRKVDSNGNFIPTYSNADIKQFAKIFTGLSTAGFIDSDPDEDPPYFGADFDESAHDRPMVMFEEQHEPGPKYLLNGAVVPAGQTGMQDIDAAINNLFEHPNVGPFMARHLIQRLVSSNPEPAYIERVALVFENNGQGVRGDLGAVVKAILTDPAARDCEDREANIHRAALREPLIRFLHACRALELGMGRGKEFYLNDGERFDESLGQMPLSANSVFNFFLPDYQPNGPIADLDLFGPEFQIHNSTTAIRYINEVNEWTFMETPVLPLLEDDEEEEEEDEDNQWAQSPKFDLRTLVELSEDPQALLDRLDVLFTHGQLSATSAQIILNAITETPEEDALDRVNMGLYLILISPDYNIIN